MRISDWSSTCALPIVVRYEYDGSVTVLADKDAQGNGFNAPNDAVVHPDDGSIWFTDPGYGQLMNYEGFRAGTGSVQIGRASCMERVCQYVSISVGPVTIKKKKNTHKHDTTTT